jgi:hypothetical protein
MSILSIDLHSSKSMIRLSFHFQNVTYKSLDDIYCSKFSTGCNPHVLAGLSISFEVAGYFQKVGGEMEVP